MLFCEQEFVFPSLMYDYWVKKHHHRTSSNYYSQLLELENESPSSHLFPSANLENERLLSPLPIAKKRESSPLLQLENESPPLIQIESVERIISSYKLEDKRSLSPLPNWKSREPSPLFQYGRGQSPLPSSNMEEERALSPLPRECWKSCEGSCTKIMRSIGSLVVF